MDSLVGVRFPNESYYVDVPQFNIKDFKVSKKFSDEVFGYWSATYIAIKRKDYDRLTKK